MSFFNEIYLVSAALGFIYIIGTALSGQFLAHGHNELEQTSCNTLGQDHQHSVHTDSSSADLQTMPDPAQTQSHIQGHANLGMHKFLHGDFHADEHAAKQDPTLALANARSNRENLPPVFVAVMQAISPIRLALFAFLFGCCGILALKLLPGQLSLLPAALLAFLGSRLYFRSSAKIMSKLNSSSNFSMESLIGQQGELTLAIENGGLGEVLISAAGYPRYSAPARARQESQSIKKLARVIVVDIKNDILVVEPFEDESLI